MSNAASPVCQPLPQPLVVPDATESSSDLAVFVETIRRKAVEQFVAAVQPLIEKAAVEWDVRTDVHWQSGKRDLAVRGHGRASGLRMAGGILVEVAAGKRDREHRNADEQVRLAGEILPANGGAQAKTREARAETAPQMGRHAEEI